MLGGLYGAPPAPAPVAAAPIIGGGLGGGVGPAVLGEIFGGISLASCYVPPKEIWLPAAKGKGMELAGTFSRKNNQPCMEMTFSNKAMQALGGFAIQLNKNR